MGSETNQIMSHSCMKYATMEPIILYDYYAPIKIFLKKRKRGYCKATQLLQRLLAANIGSGVFWSVTYGV